MGTLTKGDIVLFPFPYTDLSDRKLRPCLVLSEEMGDDIMLCQITSQRLRKDKYSIELKQADTTVGTLMMRGFRCRFTFVFLCKPALAPIAVTQSRPLKTI